MRFDGHFAESQAQTADETVEYSLEINGLDGERGVRLRNNPLKRFHEYRGSYVHGSYHDRSESAR